MDKNRHLIIKYLEGELDPETSARFEEDLKNDPSLKSELELYMEVDEALAETEIMNLRSQLKELHEEVVPKIEKAVARKPRIRIVHMAVAATLLILFTYGSFDLIKYGTGDQRVLNKYYSPLEMTMVNRSSNSDINILMHSALMLYDKAKYKEAVTAFQQVLEKDPSQMASRLYCGISFFEIKEYQKASNNLIQIIEHKDNLYVEQAEWYLGFCYLMRDEKEKAIRQFEKIVKENGYYSEKAKQILKRLV
jgi:tetratricopeptide (TPR) repeat protein